MSNLDKIVNVTIDLQKVVSSGASFDNILIIGPGPKVEASTGAPADVGVYASLSEVNDAGWVSEGNAADPVGVAARIAFSQTTKPSQIYIAVQKETGDDGALEEPTDTLARAEGDNGWYVILPAGIEEEKYEAMAEWTEAREKMFGYGYADPDSNPVKDTYFRSFGFCHGKDAKGGDAYKHIAAAVRFLSYPAGSETWVNKSLAAVSVSKFDSTTEKKISDSPASYYVQVGDSGLVLGGKTRAGEWIDVIRFIDWLKNDMQLRVLNHFVKNPKIPFTDKGIGSIRNQMIASLKEGTRRGGIAEDQYDSEGTLIPGYTTSVPLAADLSDEQKKKRALPDCKFSAIIAGAIHATTINGALVYSR